MKNVRSIVVLLLPDDHVAEDFLDRLLVADQVVVDDEDQVDARRVDRVELGEDLLAGLDPRAAAERHDDVAKLALKRATARKLQAAEAVVLHLEQVEPRRGHLAHVGLFELLVAILMQPVLPLDQKLGPGVLGLADENHVGKLAKIVFLDGDPRSADDAEAAATLELGEDLLHPEPLHAHPGHADDVGLLAALPVDRLDVFVHDRDRVLGRRQRSQQRQASDRQISPLSKEGQRVLHSPIRDLEPRIDEDDVCHRCTKLPRRRSEMPNNWPGMSN